MGKVLLEVKNLMVFYENALAINDLSISVKEGEIVGVLGSNSAGKTTLLNTISGLIMDMKRKEDRIGGVRITIMGEIIFDGKNIKDTKPLERVRMGIVLCRERHPVFADCSVIENLKIATYLRRDREIKDTMDFVFSIFPNLKTLRNRKAGFLSGGEQQMLFIGMAIMARPRLILMDEPFLGLSPRMQITVSDAIKKINQEGITILVTEQFARSLLPIVDRGYVIENGMLTLTGEGKELMENPEIQSAFLGA